MAIIHFVWIFILKSNYSHVVLCLLCNSVSKTSRSAVMHLLVVVIFEKRRPVL